jgi:ergothioneine biosynthesis protein EgtB
MSALLCAPLAIEDYGLQAMADASPAKWHLAHTTWFFETFLLKPYLPGYSPFHPRYEYLFNSYYEAIGPQFPRPERGLLSRPTVEEVYRYRAHVDAAIGALIEHAPAAQWPEIRARLELGCHHEEQHQELLLTDTKYNLSVNPLRPAYRADLPAPSGGSPPLAWIGHPGGVQRIGHEGEGFAFDNESPRHRVYLGPTRSPRGS